jgi:hypothetical protein
MNLTLTHLMIYTDMSMQTELLQDFGHMSIIGSRDINDLLVEPKMRVLNAFK